MESKVERIPLPNLTETYAFLDPAGGKQSTLGMRRIRARQAICVVSPDELGRVFVRHIWADRLPTDQLIEKIYEIDEEWQPKVFGVEANAMQALFADMLALDAKLRGIRLPLIPITQPTRIDKDFRIRSVLHPLVGHGKLLFPSSLPDTYLNEIIGFPSTQLRDVIDAVASACAMIPPRRSERQAQARRGREERFKREMAQRFGQPVRETGRVQVGSWTFGGDVRSREAERKWT